MKNRLINIAKQMKFIANGVESKAITSYLFNLESGNYDYIRVIADQLQDYCTEEAEVDERSRKMSELATDLYNQTMEYYELNVII